jgi:AcrR family transcriptional regulator
MGASVFCYPSRQGCIKPVEELLAGSFITRTANHNKIMSRCIRRIQRNCTLQYMIPLETRQKIAIASRRLLDQEGTEAVTMRRVAEAAGVTAMAIYRHYPGRDALLNALADEGFEELGTALRARRFTGTLEARLGKMTELYLNHALANPRLFELMFLKPRIGARQYPRDFKAASSQTSTLMADVIAEGMASREFKPDDHWEITFEMGALSHGLILLYLGGRMALTAVAFRALYRRSFRRYVNGIRA